MKKCLLFAVIFAALPLLAQPATSQTSASSGSSATTLPADAPSRDQVLTLMDLTQARKNMLAAVEGMKKAMAVGAEEGLRRRIPNPTPKQIDAVHQLIDASLEDLPMDEMINAVIIVYQKHFSKTDIDELIRFYSSPIGQKVLHEQPQILQESMQAGAEIQRKRFDEITLKIQKKAEELLDAEEKPAQAPKK